MSGNSLTFLHFQVYADFEIYGGAVGLSSCCVYGGSPYRAQELSLKRGVDLVVGTPGRIKVIIFCSSRLCCSFRFLSLFCHTNYFEY